MKQQVATYPTPEQITKTPNLQNGNTRINKVIAANRRVRLLSGFQ